MTEYISREAAYKFTFDIPNPNGAGEIEVVSVDDLEAIPAADVKPVVRGKWIDEGRMRHCSVCGRRKNFKENYCPSCGADMREVEHERK